MSLYYAVLGLAMAASGLLVDIAGARAAWGTAGCVYLVAAVMAVVLTRRADEPATETSRRSSEPAGMERIRTLMSEIEETRKREQQRLPTDMSVLPDAEGRPTP
jgi:membrane protein implicated in regulation of membrane protease activity